MELKSATFCLSKELEIPVLVKIGQLEGSSDLVSESERVLDPPRVLSTVSNRSDMFARAQIWSGNVALTVPMVTPYVSFKSKRVWDHTMVFEVWYSQLPFDAEVRVGFWEFVSPPHDPQKPELPNGVAPSKPEFNPNNTGLIDTDHLAVNTGLIKVNPTPQKTGLNDMDHLAVETGLIKVNHTPVVTGMNNQSPSPVTTPPFDNHHGEGKTPSQCKPLRSLASEVLSHTHESFPASYGQRLFGTSCFRLFDPVSCTLKRGIQRVAVDTGAPAPTAPEDPMYERLQDYRSGNLPAVEWLDALVFKKLETAAQTSLPKGVYRVHMELPMFSLPVVYSDLKYPVHSLSLDPEQHRESPIAEKSRKLERSQDGSALAPLKPSPKIRDLLNRILSLSPLAPLSQSDRNLVWKFRHYLSREPRGLTKFLHSINWGDAAEVAQAVTLTAQWCDISIADALELLAADFHHEAVEQFAVARLGRASDAELQLYLLQLVQALRFGNADSLAPLVTFLIARAAANAVLANFFYWYLHVEAQDLPDSVFARTLERFLTTMALQPQGEQTLQTLKRQIALFERLSALCCSVKALRESTEKKRSYLREYLADPKNGLVKFPAMPLPLDPSVTICGCDPIDSSVFKSSLLPIKITFLTPEGKYPLMFKVGDDLRQDQLVVQIITLMDNLLRNENLDLKLSPYKILATSPIAGAIQFVDNTTLDAVLKQYNGILGYLQTHSPEAGAPLGVAPAAMDTYIKSCAGYCVITYLLGVGDRHLDNLLISPTGHFFHADFGYILGADPKPFPPLMKLPLVIIDGMGGVGSDNYRVFKNYCYTTYTTLRKNSNLILNLFMLMREANIPDVKRDPEQAVQKVKEKFALELSEEEAILFFQGLIGESVNAFLPVVIDRLHSLAQYWRA